MAFCEKLRNASEKRASARRLQIHRWPTEAHGSTPRARHYRGDIRRSAGGGGQEAPVLDGSLGTGDRTVGYSGQKPRPTVCRASDVAT